MPDSPIDGPDDDAGSEPADRNPLSGTPFEQLFGGLAGGDPAGLHAMFGQLQRMFAPSSAGLNWELSRDLARTAVAQTPDPSPDAGARSRVNDTARVAEQWLDGVTDMPAVASTVNAWSRAEWVEASMPVWQRLVQPIAESVVAAMGTALPAEAQAMAGPMLGMLNSIGSAIFSAQLGQAVGAMAGEVVSASDIGVPVGDAGTAAIVVSNAKEFAVGLDAQESDVLLYLVLRECAHQRLYASAPWLRDHLFAAVEEYGRGITIDTSKIEETMHSVDLSQLESVQEALSGGLFDLDPTPSQRAALSRLETTLALVEGWVDDVVGQASDAVMPAASALREAVRRRRAAGGPAEATFAALVGLELRPRRLRDASALWGALRAAEGAAARDAVWAHPDLLPTTADLDDPLAFAERTREADALDIESAEFDAALVALLESDTRGSDVSEAADADGSEAADADGSEAAEPPEGGEEGNPGSERPTGSGSDDG